MASRALTRRLLHSSAFTRARLVDSSVSVSPEHGRAAAPPPPPPVWSPSSARPPRPPPAPTHKGPLRPRAAGEGLRPEQAHPATAAPPLRRPPPDEVNAPRAAPQEDLERAVTLDLFLLRTLAQLTERRASASSREEAPLAADLGTLLAQHREREGTVVDDALAYEPTPTPARRVRLDGRAGAHEAAPGAGVEEQDGTVVVAHVLGGGETRVSVCSGFAVGKANAGEGQLILTCAHTLESMQKFLRPASSAVPSATFVLASSGHVYTVTSLASSSSEADLLLLRLSPSPINPSAIPILPLRTLPISPYPPPTSSAIAMHGYVNPLARLRRKLQRLPEREWTRGRIAEYKDPIGRTAEVGTYDALAAMWVDCCPSPGSSGGPVVDCETGSVVGVTRGSTHQHGERQRYGFATPAERIFELFRLPGFKTTAERNAEKQAAQQASARRSAVGGREGEAK
ncbi:hypothetical protein JCM10450v2_006136 [Rhodotorula kratochvilovae]